MGAHPATTNRSLQFWLMAFITMVEPSLMVRTNIRATKPMDQEKLASRGFFLEWSDMGSGSPYIMTLEINGVA